MSAYLLARGEYSTKVVATLGALVLTAWWACAVAAQDEAVRPMQTLANLLLSLREGDFSVRGKNQPVRDAASLAVSEVNTLAALLQEQRRLAIEATALLGKVTQEVDIAIVAFDETGVVRMLNPFAARLLSRDAIGEAASTLGLGALLEGDPNRTVPSLFGQGPWELRRQPFRQNGSPHTLVVLSDLRRALREEERQAWQKLVRVLGHEIGNSLAPIQSLAGSLQAMVAKSPRIAGWEGKLQHGLDIVERRAAALDRFLQAYARMSRLPPPTKRSFDVGEWITRIAALEQRVSIAVLGGPTRHALGDPDQLDQVLINLTRNAVDAALETSGGVSVRWEVGEALRVVVQDDGPGVAEASHLFVPFFTTKPNGSGIGLALSRQIAEAHGGTLTLTSTPSRPGCVAVLTLPLEKLENAPT